MITLDTSALFAALDRLSRDHRAVMDIFMRERGQLLLPCGILAEVAYLVERDLGKHVIGAFVDDLVAERYRVDCGLSDFQRVSQLMGRYSDLPLGYADAAVIACAERNGGRVATLDHRHFGVVAREGTIKILP